MPIRPDLRQFYGREWRTVIRPRILARAGDKCEQCQISNHTDVTRIGGAWLDEKVSWREGITKQWRDNGGRLLLERPAGKTRRIRVVLTIGHLNHVSGDDRDENLKAFCQWCHLHYDREHHAETRAIRKDAARPILIELTKTEVLTK